MLGRYKVILWDFDGVILDSMPTRDKGFEIALADFPQEQVEAVLEYHRQNGGLSRYVKFRFLYEQIRQEEVTDQQIQQLADRFSEYMRTALTDRSLLIRQTVDFIDRSHAKYDMHIVSGSDQNELRFLNSELGIAHYFKTITGSPRAKKDLVADIMAKENYDIGETVLIGDSINDFDAAEANEIHFIGFNKPSLREKGVGYIDSFVGL